MALATNSTPGSIVLGGDLTGNANAPELRPTGVTPGEYVLPTIVVDAAGRVCSSDFTAASVSSPGLGVLGEGLDIAGSIMSLAGATNLVLGGVKSADTDYITITSGEVNVGPKVAKVDQVNLFEKHCGEAITSFKTDLYFPNTEEYDTQFLLSSSSWPISTNPCYMIGEVVHDVDLISWVNNDADGRWKIAPLPDASNLPLNQMSYVTSRDIQSAGTKLFWISRRTGVVDGETQYQAYVASSDDGVIWSDLELLDCGTLGSGITIQYGNGVYLAVGARNEPASYSTDGITWNMHFITYGGVNLRETQYQHDIFFEGGLFLACVTASDTSIKVVRSVDAINWIASDFVVGLTGPMQIRYGGSRYVAAPLKATSSTYKMAYSDDAIVWKESNVSWGQRWIGLEYGSGMWVAIAATTSGLPTNVGVYSSDGITWTQFTLPASARWSSLTYGNGKFVCVALSSDLVAYSSDGITWATSTLPSSTIWDNLVYIEGVGFVATTTQTGITNSPAAISADAITWTDISCPSNIEWTAVHGTKVIAVSRTNKFSCIYDATITDCPYFPQGYLFSNSRLSGQYTHVRCVPFEGKVYCTYY